MNESEASFHLPFCRTYSAVTTKGLVTSLPPTTVSSRILFDTGGRGGRHGAPAAASALGGRAVRRRLTECRGERRIVDAAPA